MNRPIKFRVWDKQNNCFQTPKNGAEIFELLSLEYQGQIACTDAFIFQQFTGLLDKNGREIYEGDILRVTDTYQEWGEEPKTTIRLSKVVWYEEGAFWQEYLDWVHTCSGVKDGEPVTGWIHPKTSEIIGNIFENPELIKK